MDSKTVDVMKWLEENKEDFVPPVCNKCMFSNQLKLFFVGGPNSRDDYHLEEGEEFFYQQTGDMVLKVIERGQPRDIRINEGEVFLLPSRVEHSPQRFANTVGFVLERARENTEFDCVRYFVKSSTVRLFERWFHLNDVVRDLPPLIQAFRSSEECRNGIPGPKSFLINAPYEAAATDLSKPMNLQNFIEKHKEATRNAPVQIYGPPSYSTNVLLYGEGEHILEVNEFELIIWIMEDSIAILECSTESRRCSDMSMTLCSPRSKYKLNVKKGHGITLQMSMQKPLGQN
ncbi:hypothetical protein Angca_006385 [Angiostrongylus cantonensis]|nr:hypothetical protein Angca_006385 [Angiostrongylus cantonensis]